MLNQEQLAFLAEILPCWKAMDREHQRLLERTMTERSVKRGEYLYQGDRDCTGVFWLRYGQARVFLISGTEKQITLYRLLERDSCFLSASCVIKNINFDVFIQAEKDCRILSRSNGKILSLGHLLQSNFSVSIFRCDVGYGANNIYQPGP